MKIIHLSDLHLGKRLKNLSLMEDQRYILKEILKLIDLEEPQAVLISGDIYDKAVPSAEAVELFDDFLFALSKRSAQVFIISGNHDSPERLAFGGRLMDKSGIHLSPVYNGTISPVTLEDAYGSVNFYLLPFLKPAHVRAQFPEEEFGSYTEALRIALKGLPIAPKERNVLLTHQFVTGAERSESEDISVGGSDNVDASVFDGFDYVALGHLHKAQNVGSETVRYCGTPLKYSFSESSDRKTLTVVELDQKGSLTVRELPLTPKRDLLELRGTYNELTLRSFYEGTPYPESYLKITLTDEEDIIDGASKLRVFYPYLLELAYDNTRMRHTIDLSEAADVRGKTPLELFADFYALRNGSSMTEEQTQLVLSLIEKIWEEKL